MLTKNQKTGAAAAAIGAVGLIGVLWYESSKSSSAASSSTTFTAGQRYRILVTAASSSVQFPTMTVASEQAGFNGISPGAFSVFMVSQTPSTIDVVVDALKTVTVPGSLSQPGYATATVTPLGPTPVTATAPGGTPGGVVGPIKSGQGPVVGVQAPPGLSNVNTSAPPPPTSWARVQWLANGKTYRMSMSVSAFSQIVQNASPTLTQWQSKLTVAPNYFSPSQLQVWGPGPNIPSDWPSDDPSPGTEFHAQFVFGGTTGFTPASEPFPFAAAMYWGQS